MNPVSIFTETFIWKNSYWFCKSESGSLSVGSDSESPRTATPKPVRLFCPWNSPGKDTGVGSQSLLQRVFWTQGSHPGDPPALQVDSLPSEPQGKQWFFKTNTVLYFESFPAYSLLYCVLSFSLQSPVHSDSTYLWHLIPSLNYLSTWIYFLW